MHTINNVVKLVYKIEYKIRIVYKIRIQRQKNTKQQAMQITGLQKLRKIRQRQDNAENRRVQIA